VGNQDEGIRDKRQRCDSGLLEPLPAHPTFESILGTRLPTTRAFHVGTRPVVSRTQQAAITMGNRVAVVRAVEKGTTQEHSFRTTVPQRKLQRTSTIRRFTTLHAFDQLSHCGGGALIKLATQRLAVHSHHIFLPVARPTIRYDGNDLNKRGYLPRSKTQKEFDRDILRGDFRPYIVERNIPKGFDLKLNRSIEEPGTRDAHRRTNSPWSRWNRSFWVNRAEACPVLSALADIAHAHWHLET
jgi:hypothetical protein